MSLEAELKHKCAYHPRRAAKTHCGSCDKPICDDDTWGWSPEEGDQMDVCTECHDYFRGADIPRKEKLWLRIMSAVIVIIAFFGVSAVVRNL